jgi:hypothetical protein
MSVRTESTNIAGVHTSKERTKQLGTGKQYCTGTVPNAEIKYRVNRSKSAEKGVGSRLGVTGKMWAEIGIRNECHKIGNRFFNADNI